MLYAKVRSAAGKPYRLPAVTFPPHEISSAPAAIALGTVGLIITATVLRRRAALSLPRLLVGAALCVYAAGIVVNSAFPIYLDAASGGAWTSYLNLVPLRGTEPADMARNALIFAPLGVLLPLVLPIRSVGALAAAAFVLSFTIEVLQLVNALTGNGGHVADVNDLLANVLGAPVGYVAVRAATAFAPTRRLLSPFAWPTAGLVRSPTQRDRRSARVDTGELGT
ncbi:VanZ family protein [Patulibacter sp.]|uniref:VanZ family protein n=1 Tax=Patulibacter sp. TaxID=1912859 RepID=UPI002723AF4A|nr:VanZ family protein [Patulibacter sp.]MDO9408583.1 VanZ family protein [Patulibacter sp.]